MDGTSHYFDHREHWNNVSARNICAGRHRASAPSNSNGVGLQESRINCYRNCVRQHRNRVGQHPKDFREIGLVLTGTTPELVVAKVVRDNTEAELVFMRVVSDKFEAVTQSANRVA